MVVGCVVFNPPSLPFFVQLDNTGGRAMDWIIDNKEWLFGGILIAVPLAIFGWILSARKSTQRQKSGDRSTNIQVGNSVKINKK